MSRTNAYPKTEKAISAFSGQENVRLRRIIRNALEAGHDVRTVARHVGLTAAGQAKLQAVHEAWEQETRLSTDALPSEYDCDSDHTAGLENTGEIER